ncbi:YmfQ family protein [Desulfosporosinus shakirovi]|uniref:YmfQ family protein n=1 Tax=Desulfosporosinus shakirovi TaxID=2885154 RepID=UPI001E5F7ACD|nr:YmfQ family protein [Desulfosporosinus sp. SRJS8]MCB8818355.1 YmfQ family protein [Desulfosporosinus sp. SRJS8]
MAVRLKGHHTLSKEITISQAAQLHFDRIEVGIVADGGGINSIDIGIVDLNVQFNVSTATWALDSYEKDLGITTDYSKPLRYRRSVIESKWRGSGNTALEPGNPIFISYNEDGNVVIKDTINIQWCGCRHIVLPNLSGQMHCRL